MVDDVNMKRILICVSGFYSLFSLVGSCGPSEYKSAGGECCPMCSIGSVVYQDCSDDLSTTCKPCAPGTFMNEPSGLYRCYQCSACVENKGLYTQTKCTTISNTICEVLDGYHCIEISDSQCIHAEKHSICKPGQETKTQGTKTSDTVCANCSHGFYSTFGFNCIEWTNCGAKSAIQIKDGSPVKDVTCALQRKRYGLIVSFIASGILSALAAFKLLSGSSESQKDHKCDKRPRAPIEETTPKEQTGENIVEFIIEDT